MSANEIANLQWDERLVLMWNRKLIPDVLDRVATFGFSRTGKSSLIERLTGAESITSHEGMMLEDLLGSMQLVNGSTQWVDGPAARAMRNGVPLLINELIDKDGMMAQECITSIYALMDKPAAITLANGERLVAKKGYAFIATFNPPPDKLPHPIFDRFDVFLKADKISTGLAKELGPLAAKAQNVVGVGQPALTWERKVTVNALLALHQLRKAGVQDEEAAIMLGFHGRAQTDFLTVIAGTK